MAALDENRNMGDWLRQLDRDVKALQARQGTVTIGRYALRENDDGDLVVVNTETGTVTVLT